METTVVVLYPGPTDLLQNRLVLGDDPVQPEGARGQRGDDG
jgi:hypothetical protein